ncbi:tRNA adenosine(34) deaminase TadA [Candidatus Kinetoplastidibacterium crithidiae]|uniref:tRNA-specific adenosine deaminase n=1 Tax=Candidatus Kinetoplastidibacterium crithidiae TCC036E TaxID=1208918 RepID=M1M5X6_9PROT|nr:tRNA adenosine(34) deaminase TadA [Candidatus Kinetoplastibacterium crithidii]AGF47550.1 zinc-binding cytosine/adenosine deaminase [Candidatus Kinetoplastibacterium crithidii TCC036E]
MEYDHMMLELALKEAENAYKIGEVPVGAVIVDSDRNPIGYGYNRTIVDNDPTAHAEIVAIRSVAKNINNYRFSGMSLYVTLEPCLMCLGAIFSARITKVVFGAKDYKTGVCGSVINLPSLKEINHHTNVLQFNGDLVSNCSHILSKFFKNLRTSIS